MKLLAFLLCFALLTLSALHIIRPSYGIDYTDSEIGAA